MKSKIINVIFFGTPDFVLPICEVLGDLKEFHLAAVITSPDKPLGRKQILTPSPVKQWALEHKIPVLTPEKLDQNFLNILISQYPNIELGILAAYGKIIPQEIIDLFPKGILVIHPSLLPKYRGASPVPAAILEGDKETGVTIFKMDSQMDHGPIITRFKEEIKANDTTERLLPRLFGKTTDILITILKPYIEDKIIPRTQNHKLATYCRILTKKDGYFDYKNPPDKEILNRMIRAYYPWPGVWTLWQEKRVKLLPNDLVQLEGKNPVSWRQFKQAYPEFEVTF